MLIMTVNSENSPVLSKTSAPHEGNEINRFYFLFPYLLIVDIK